MNACRKPRPAVGSEYRIGGLGTAPPGYTHAMDILPPHTKGIPARFRPSRFRYGSTQQKSASAARHDTDERDDIEETARPALKFGWIAKGLLFLVIGILAIELARRGSPSEDADQTGALAAIADAPAGRVLVFVVSIGLLLYAVWQAWAAVVQETDGLLHAAKRVGWVGLSFVYGLLAITGLQIAIVGGAAESGDESGPTTPSGIVSRLFEVPAGRAIVVAIGVGTAIVGLYQLQKGVRGGFLDDIETDGLEDSRLGVLRVLGTSGFIARALLLGIAGYLFIDASLTYNPERAAGIDDSLRALAGVPYGRVLLAVTGIGLAAAGVYDMITYQLQRIDKVDR